TFLDEFFPRTISNLPGAFFPGTPAGTTVLLEQGGGGSNLRPEKTNNWTAGIDWHPTAIRGLVITATYFHFRRRDRIVFNPIAQVTSAVSNPLYAPLVTLDPSSSFQEAELQGATFTPFVPYNPSNVGAFIDDAAANLSRQTASGVNFLARESWQWSATDKLTASVAATYLRLEQALTHAAPEIEVSGTIFNPPRFKARSGLVWQSRDWSLSG